MGAEVNIKLAVWLSTVSQRHITSVDVDFHMF
jgi:hypothetical protein